MSNTIKLHRVLKAPTDRVYKAFTDPDAKCRWLPPYGYVAKVHEYDLKEGGVYKMSFTNFRTGGSHSWSGKYLELKPNQIIRYTDKFDDPNMTEEMQVTVTLKEVLCGTEISITQENIPPQIPVEFCYLGWQESLTQLALLVEPEIP